MDEKLLEAIEDFIICRLDDHGANAPEAVQEAISQTAECMNKLEESLNDGQKQLFRELEEALSVQVGEEMHYYYRAGMNDALGMMLDRSLFR